MRTLPVQSKRHQEFVKNWVAKNAYKKFHGNAMLEIMNRIGLTAEEMADFKMPEATYGAAERMQAWEREKKALDEHFGISETVKEMFEKQKESIFPHIDPAKGPFNYKKTPYTREIIDAMNTPGPHEEVVIMKGSAMGATIQPIDMPNQLTNEIMDSKREEGYYWVLLEGSDEWEPAWWDLEEKEWFLRGERSGCVSSLIPVEVDERRIVREE